MKSLVIAITFSLLGLGALAQTATTKKVPVKATTKTATSYRCPVCGAASDKTGECSKDKVAFVKVGDYYCPDCYMTSAKAGKCTMCGVDMKKMEVSTSKK